MSILLQLLNAVQFISSFPMKETFHTLDLSAHDLAFSFISGDNFVGLRYSQSRNSITFGLLLSNKDGLIIII